LRFEGKSPDLICTVDITAETAPPAPPRGAFCWDHHMPDMDAAALSAALDDLRRKLAKRRNQAGFAGNVQALETRIAELQADRAVLGAA
jgi:hypothetical protein